MSILWRKDYNWCDCGCIKLYIQVKPDLQMLPFKYSMQTLRHNVQCFYRLLLWPMDLQLDILYMTCHTHIFDGLRDWWSVCHISTEIEASAESEMEGIGSFYVDIMSIIIYLRKDYKWCDCGCIKPYIQVKSDLDAAIQVLKAKA